MELASQYESIVPRGPECVAVWLSPPPAPAVALAGVALRLAREGMKVVINSRTAETVAAVTDGLQALGVEAIGVAADLGATAGVDRLFEETVRTFGTVDLLVNNAASLKR